MHSLLNKKKTYKLKKLIESKKALKNKQVFKLEKDGEKLLKYENHLIVKDFNKKKVINFDDIFSLIVKMSYIQVVLCLIASMDSSLRS